MECFPRNNSTWRIPGITVINSLQNAITIIGKIPQRISLYTDPGNFPYTLYRTNISTSNKNFMIFFGPRFHTCSHRSASSYFAAHIPIRNTGIKEYTLVSPMIFSDSIWGTATTSARIIGRQSSFFMTSGTRITKITAALIYHQVPFMVTVPNRL